MLKEYAKSLTRLLRIVDLLIILGSFLAAYYFRFGTINLFDPGRHYEGKVFLTIFVISWVYLGNLFHLYSSKRFSSLWSEARDILVISTCCSAIAILAVFFLRDNPLSRLFLVYLWSLQTGTMVAFRLVTRTFLKYVRAYGYNSRNVLIIGRNERAAKLAEAIEANPASGLSILGFLDAPNGNGFHLFSYGLAQLGQLEDLERIIKTRVVDEVFVTLPLKSFYSEIEDIVNVCEKAGIEVKIPTDLFQVPLSKSTITSLGSLPFIDLYTSPRMDLQLMTKRLLDIVLSFSLLILFSPMFAVLSLLIKATSPGPVFFTQRRVGYNGRLFTCLKFRTMVANAEAMKGNLLHLNEMDGPVFKIKNDPRVTRVGQFLRKSSLDELPQLINVLRGDMSIVGPRPPTPDEVEQYAIKDRRRLSMRPGITCLWQVSGRNHINFEKWMELDRQYIDRWSLWLDFKILARTIPAVLRAQGAA